MAGKRWFRDVEKRLKKLGYELDHMSNCGKWIYSHPSRPELSVNPSMNEGAARQFIAKLDRDLGVEKKVNKRNATAVKERQQAERDRARAELERLEQRRAEILAARDALPTGDLDGLDREQRVALARELEQIEAEHRRWTRLMTEVPVALTNSARHTAGAR